MAQLKMKHQEELTELHKKRGEVKKTITGLKRTVIWTNLALQTLHEAGVGWEVGQQAAQDRTEQREPSSNMRPVSRW